MRNRIGISILILLLFGSFIGCKAPDDNTNYEIIPEITYYDVTWKDTDGTVLAKTKQKMGTSPFFYLPSDTEVWDYTSWYPSISPIYKDMTYTAQRDIREDYFIGNVFQIITYDLEMNPIALGTGFVFNSNGYFITNHHVMKEGYFAEALFDVRDYINQESNVRLRIEYALYEDENKDFFIGKVEEYAKYMSEYYKDIEFNTNYNIGDMTYSVGYPNASVDIEINEGYIVDDVSSIRDKVIDGVSYIGSTSFIAPGSSGGILINDDIEIIGLTTIGITQNNTFVLGGSLETFYFLQTIHNLQDFVLEDYAVFSHPEEAIFITAYKNLLNNPDAEPDTWWDGSFDGLKLEQVNYGVNGDGIEYSNTISIYLYPKRMLIRYVKNTVFGNGDRKTLIISGYLAEEEIDDFDFILFYDFADGRSSKISSYLNTYDRDISFTMSYYYDDPGNIYFPYTTGLITEDYMKSQFNDHCENFFDYFNIDY